MILILILIPRVLQVWVIILCLWEWPIAVMWIAIIALTIHEKIFEYRYIVIIEASFPITAIDVIVNIIIVPYAIWQCKDLRESSLLRINRWTLALHEIIKIHWMHRSCRIIIAYEWHTLAITVKRINSIMDVVVVLDYWIIRISMYNGLIICS